MSIFNSIYCYDGGKKHNYIPRYTETDSNHNMNNYECSSISVLKEFRKFRINNVYVHDICTWCGDIKGKNKNEN